MPKKRHVVDIVMAGSSVTHKYVISCFFTRRPFISHDHNSFLTLTEWLLWEPWQKSTNLNQNMIFTLNFVVPKPNQSLSTVRSENGCDLTCIALCKWTCCVDGLVCSQCFQNGLKVNVEELEVLSL